MSKTNCVTCGHGKDPNEIKCPFCGTTYLDFTSIDFSSDKPVVLTMVLPNKDKDICQMVTVPRLDRIDADFNQRTFYLGGVSYTTEPEIEFGVSFSPIVHDGKLITIRKGEQT